jgi:hypothetical protein
MGSSGDAEGVSRQGTGRGGEQQRRLQQWGLQSVPAGEARPQVIRARGRAVVGEALVLTARELRLVLTLLLVMFMTGEVWRYAGTRAGPRLVLMIAGPVMTALALIAVGLRRQLRATETVHVPGAADGEPTRAVVAPRVAHRRLVGRATGRVWLETLSASIAVAALFTFLGVAALVFAAEVLVDEESRHELLDDLLEGYNQAVTVWAAGETGATGEPTAIQSP